MNPAIARTHPSDLFDQAVQTITAKTMGDILGCGYTHIRKQASHPDRNGEARTSFIEKIERMFAALMEKSPTFARTLCDRICRVCKGKFVPDTGSKADKKTLAEELLDNIPAFSAYTEIMRDPNATFEEKQAAKLILIDELEQDFDEQLK